MFGYKKATLGVLVLIEMFYIWTTVLDRQTYIDKIVQIQIHTLVSTRNTEEI